MSKASGGVTTYFLYDGDRLLCELDAAGSVLRSYTWGPLGLVSDRAGGQSRFTLFDPLGNTRQQLAADGAILSRGA